ncbi:MAG: hypothetical protein WD490_10620 [Opitutales bacterium]
MEATMLPFPPRSPDAPGGLNFKKIIAPLPLAERENAIYAQIAEGNIPDFLRSLVPITTNAVINGVNHTITYTVTPDYMAVGSDEDYFLMPMTPLLAQRLADLLDCSLPTRKMVDEIWSAAPVKLAPSPISPSAAMITVPVFYDHNIAVRQQRAQVLPAHPLGALVGGTKKDVIVSNQTATRPPPPRVCIYGWHQLDGSPIQPLSTVHDSTYADYSHGVRLVQNAVVVDTAPMTMQQVLADPALAALLSDEGVIANPRYPLAATASSDRN